MSLYVNNEHMEGITTKLLPKNLTFSEVVGHMPIIKDFAKKVGLVETLDTMVDSQMDLSPGITVLAMVLDTLSGRTPLYRTGTQKLFSQIAQNAIGVFDVDPRRVHFDTTSISVFGDYDFVDPPLKITYGHSKDKRSDLKQFLVSMLSWFTHQPMTKGGINVSTGCFSKNAKRLKQIAKKSTQALFFARPMPRLRPIKSLKAQQTLTTGFTMKSDKRRSIPGEDLPRVKHGYPLDMNIFSILR